MSEKPLYMIQLYDIGVPLKNSINLPEISSFIGLYFEPSSKFRSWFDTNESALQKLSTEAQSNLTISLDSYYYAPIPEIAHNLEQYFNFYKSSSGIQQEAPPLAKTSYTEVPVLTGGFNKNDIVVLLIGILFYVFSTNRINLDYLPKPKSAIDREFIDQFGGGAKIKDLSGDKSSQRLIYVIEKKNYPKSILKIVPGENYYKYEINIYDELTNFAKNFQLLEKNIIKKNPSGNVALYNRADDVFVFNDAKADTGVYPIGQVYTTEGGGKNMQKCLLEQQKVCTKATIDGLKKQIPNKGKDFNLIIDNGNGSAYESLYDLYSDNVAFGFPTLYMVLEYNTDYMTLEDTRKIKPSSTNFLSPEKKCQIAEKLIPMLKYLRDNLGFSHWDLHAGNLLVNPETADFKLFDFDLSRTDANNNLEIVWRLPFLRPIDVTLYGLAYDIYRLIQSLRIEECSSIPWLNSIVNAVNNNFSRISFENPKTPEEPYKKMIDVIKGAPICQQITEIIPLILESESAHVPLIKLNEPIPESVPKPAEIQTGGKCSDFRLKYLKYKSKYLKAKNNWH